MYEFVQLADLLNLVSQFVMIYMFCMFGSYVHEVLLNYKRKNRKINTKKFLVTALVVAILIFSLSNYIKLEPKEFMGVCFFVGVVSEQIASLLMDLDGWMKLLKYIGAITKGMKSGIYEGIKDIEKEEEK